MLSSVTRIPRRTTTPSPRTPLPLLFVRRRCLSEDSHRRQQAAFDFYRQKKESTLSYKLFGHRKRSSTNYATQHERNIQIAWYGAAIVVGALGATYAAVPLYKVFCQTTGFGGTTQRVRIGDSADNEGPVERFLRQTFDKLPTTTARVHTWTDEEAAARLASLKPVKNADLLTIRFDTTVGDVLPWSKCKEYADS
jgi:hypothetical protein